MKIVNRKTFLALPAETLFSKYEPCIFGDLLIKGDSIGEIDFFYQSIKDAVDCRDCGEFTRLLDVAQETGSSVPMDFDCQGRDGLFEEDELYAVWEPQDVQHLINRLRRALSTEGTDT